MLGELNREGGLFRILFRGRARGVHYIYFGCGDVPSGRVSIFQILV